LEGVTNRNKARSKLEDFKKSKKVSTQRNIVGCDVVGRSIGEEGSRW